MVLLARALSYALHPLLMPVLTLWLALELDPHLGYFLDPQQRWTLLAMVALMTIAFPVASSLLLLRAGAIRSLEMHERRERILPFTITLLYYGMTWYLLARTGMPNLPVLVIGATVALAAATLITLRWKISAHMIGIGGCLGALAALQAIHHLDLFLPLAILVTLCGVVGTARMLTSDHTQAQVYMGALVGFGCVFATVVLWPSAGM